jgi:ferredoxin--NADP+ reductase
LYFSPRQARNPSTPGKNKSGNILFSRRESIVTNVTSQTQHVTNSSQAPLRIAVFGAGPAGFYATDELLKNAKQPVRVDLFDRLPTPYGLVRGGVAPDHAKIKAVIKQYEKIAQRPGFRFFGNVTFGQDLTREEVLAHYHHVIFTTGSETDRRMGIPGEDLPGSYSATAFVGWYNGHPDYQHLSFDLRDITAVAVIGNGNVAMDVARILARSTEELSTTDITENSLNVLRQSAVRSIIMCGRRGPAQAAFTNPEIRELAELTGVDLVVRPDELALDEANQQFMEAHSSEPTHQRNLDTLNAQIAKGEGTQARKIYTRFFVSPVEVLGQQRVEGLRLERNVLVRDERGNFQARGTGQYEEISCQMIFRSIGYKGQLLADLPFDDRQGVIPNNEGRVIDPATKEQIPRLYVAGWIKRGPSGVIGTNKADAVATVESLLSDIEGQPRPQIQGEDDAITTFLTRKDVRYVTFSDWQNIDKAEIANGRSLGKPREKFITVPAMLAATQAS